MKGARPASKVGYVVQEFANVKDRIRVLWTHTIGGQFYTAGYYQRTNRLYRVLLHIIVVVVYGIGGVPANPWYV